MVIHKLEKRVNSHQWNMAPIRIIAKCTVIPHDGFLSGPYVIYFHFMNIHSTSNLDKYMARSSCIWPRTAEQLHRHKVLCSCAHVTRIALPSLCWGEQSINVKGCVGVTGALSWPLCWEIKVGTDSSTVMRGGSVVFHRALHLGTWNLGWSKELMETTYSAIWHLGISKL